MPSSFDSIHLPITRHPTTGQIVRSWFWLTDWKVDLKHPNVDPLEGWQYAKSLDDKDDLWTPEFPSIISISGWVRRRRWIRVRKRRVDVNQLSSDELKSSVVMIDENDYVNRAASGLTVADADAETDLSERTSESLRAELASYEKAIQILLGGIKTDSNIDRKKMATSLVSTHLQRAEILQDAISASEESGSIPHVATLTSSTTESEADDHEQLSAHALEARRRAKGKGKVVVVSVLLLFLTERNKERPTDFT